MPAIIRSAQASDLDFIVEGNASLARETENKHLDPATLRSGVAALLAAPEKGRYFIAELDGQAAGQIMFTTEWSDWRNGYFWWIQSVYVVQAARRHGVFTALYRHVEQLARKDGAVCGLRLYVEHDNQTAQRTYRRLGLDSTQYSLMELEFKARRSRQETFDAQAR